MTCSPSLLTKERLSPTIIDPRHRGGPQAAAVVVEGIAVSIQGMVEVGIIPEMGTETFTRGEKGWETKGKGFLKGTTLFSTCRKRGLTADGQYLLCKLTQTRKSNKNVL